HAGCVVDRIGDRRRDRPHRWFAGAAWSDILVIDEHHIDRFRRLGDVEDWIGLPIDAGDVVFVELDLLMYGTADRLDDVAFDRAGQLQRVDDHAAIMRYRELARPYGAGPG